MFRLFRWLLTALVVVVLGAGAVLVWGWNDYTKPGPLPEARTVVIPKGASVAAIAGKLDDVGVIDNPLVFQLAVRLQKPADPLRAGEYAFPPAVSIEQAIAILRSGETVVRRLTVPEGLTSIEVVNLLNAAPALEGQIEQRVPEGTLLPETYHYSYGDSRADLLHRMQAAMQSAVAELWAARPPDLPLASPDEAVILASIVEKETAVPAERPRVAAVFYNRLAKGMRLQSDPTVAYGIAGGEGGLTRPLTRADLEQPNPYNTYMSDGLPPGPIANPGRDALAAVINPADTDDLYFVADGSGGHAFARTLQEHNRNVARWRKLQRSR